jgi:hypothetical protein
MRPDCSDHGQSALSFGASGLRESAIRKPTTGSGGGWLCYRILAHPRSLNLRSPEWIGGLGVDWRAKVDLFEQLRREHEFGIGTIAR